MNTLGLLLGYQAAKKIKDKKKRSNIALLGALTGGNGPAAALVPVSLAQKEVAVEAQTSAETASRKAAADKEVVQKQFGEFQTALGQAISELDDAGKETMHRVLGNRITDEMRAALNLKAIKCGDKVIDGAKPAESAVSTECAAVTEIAKIGKEFLEHQRLWLKKLESAEPDPVTPPAVPAPKPVTENGANTEQ